MIEDVENCTYCASGMGCYHHSSKWMSEKIKDLQSRLDMAVKAIHIYREALEAYVYASMSDKYDSEETINAMTDNCIAAYDEDAGFKQLGEK